MIWISFIHFGCSQPDVLEPWSDDPQTLLRQCESQTDLAPICWVQAAAVLAQNNREPEAAKICADLTAIWKQECHFRVGEELAAKGELPMGIQHCILSDQFAQNCITHAMWRTSIATDLNSNMATKDIQNAFVELKGNIEAKLRDASPSLRHQTIDNLMPQFAHSMFVGSAIANPKLAHLSGDEGVWYRTAFAIEAARILWQKSDFSIAQIIENWKTQTTITGLPSPEQAFKGRYRPTRISPMEEAKKRTIGFAGGSRLVGDTPEEDIVIAALEGAFWVEDTPPDVFLPWLDDSRENVHLTAAKLLSQIAENERKLTNKLRILSKNYNNKIKWYLDPPRKRK